MESDISEIRMSDRLILENNLIFMLKRSWKLCITTGKSITSKTMINY